MTNKRLNSHLKKNEIETLKMLLEAEKIRLEESFKDKTFNQEDTTNCVKDEVDSANDAILLSQNQRFTKRDFLYYKKINKTLELIKEDEFGICQDCAAPISFARLKARPTSEMCIHCKEEAEKEERQNYFKRQSKSLTETVVFSNAE